MKAALASLVKNELFLILFNGMLAYIAFIAVILATLQVPPEAILDSGLKEIILIFEE